MSTNDAVIEFLLNQLRQQLTNNPYKQQCEDLAHEVLSLKNQLRDASALVAELQETIKLMNEDFKRTTANPEYREELSQHYKDMMSITEQSGCRKEDTRECEHEWFRHLDKDYCFKCGVTKPEECEHEWVEFHGLVITPDDPRNEPGYLFCRKCGLKEHARKCAHEWSYVMGDGPGVYECDVCGAQSKTLPYDLRWLA